MNSYHEGLNYSVLVAILSKTIVISNNIFGASEKIKLVKSNKPVLFRKYLEFKGDRIVIFEPDFPVFWKPVY
jgi:hypothetical protein